jgi:hypothetical protein
MGYGLAWQHGVALTTKDQRVLPVCGKRFVTAIQTNVLATHQRSDRDTVDVQDA